MALRHVSPGDFSIQLTHGFSKYFGEPLGAAFNLGSDRTIYYNVDYISDAGGWFAEKALDAWAAVSGINFVASSYSNADIRFGQSDSSGAYATTYFDGYGDITQANVNIPNWWISGDSYNLNSYGYQTYLHEIGHALGLGHAGNYNGLASFPYDAKFANDSWQMSVMSYFSQTDNPNVNASFAYVLTPMAADIIAINRLYGLPNGGDKVNTSNTVWGLNSNAQGPAANFSLQQPAMTMTIFDQGGNDTLDVSNTGHYQVINLKPGHFSSVYGKSNNIYIDRLSHIENAAGGNGVDKMIGNAFANKLSGGAGADKIYGGGGNDELRGEHGADVLFGESGIDTIFGDVGWDIIRGGDGSDNIYGGSGNDALIGERGHDFIQGGDGNDDIRGGLNNDTLYGNAGGDRILGEDGLDTIFGDVGWDIIRGGSGSDNIDGGRGDDALFGDRGHDLVKGGDGNDTIHGGMDNDTLLGGVGADNIYGGHGRDTIYGGSDADLISGGDGNDQIYGDAGADALIGNSGNDVIFGGDGNDLMAGGYGFDVLIGGAGNDRLNGEASRDRLNGGQGHDVMIGGPGGDTFYFNDGNDVVQDFSDAQGDIIEIDSALVSTSNVASFIASNASSDGHHTTITFDNGDTLMLLGVTDPNSIVDDVFFV
ncbi:M10 family metallopeptidase [Aliiroseovarius sp. F47248L]|uniref:M10 family metallopeptidase n=1 Tax=Aliiroseovarius sp. F47248L TaxID=2926420 RepID=UPI001FF2C366|nr:M10 family metallopeptidase [Aliiroseovarius sp. F47248L]MCK0139973.1 M10 family metallopeptidase C-terminal domain-containing protein [Aliiroseovarius sp. F47248L]